MRYKYLSEVLILPVLVERLSQQLSNTSYVAANFNLTSR